METRVEDLLDFPFVMIVDFYWLWQWLDATGDSINDVRGKKRNVKDGMDFHGTREFELVGMEQDLLHDFKWS